MKNFWGNKILIRTIQIFITAMLLSSPTFAQWTFGLSTDQEYNSNPFRSPITTPSLISSFDFGLENEMNNFSIGYYGSYLNISAIAERNFYWHQFALWKDFENSSLGIYAEQRINRELYSYFDYTNITTYYRQQFNFHEFYFSINPNISYTKYDNISILDNLKGSFGLNVNHGFESETTLILGSTINYKKYLSPSQTETISYLDESNNLITETFSDKNISSITQLVSYIRVAQSLAEETGIAAQFTNRSILNGFATSVKEINMVYGDEAEIFDDPINYEGNNLSFELTQVLFNDMTLKAGYYFNKKYYPSQGIYDELSAYDTGIMRTDTQNIFSLYLSKRFSLDSSDNVGLSAGLTFRSINNKSNSYWFNYKSNSINLSLSLGF
ncbi:MAG: hypothetical protein RDU14_11370 [Melioribacteraceae bacterium]|nr:hypothetical protein [Melioribacteraceae bacterium]